MINNKGHVLAFDDSSIMENSPLDSITYNKIIDSLKASTLRCINRTRDIAAKVSKFNKALSAENRYLSSLVAQQHLDYSNLGDKDALVTGFDNPVSQSSLAINSLTGQVTINPLHKWSKVVRYQDRTGRDRASRDINISFGPVGNPVALPADHDIYSILDGYADTFWLADVQDKAQYTLRIQFPASIKPYVDYLSLIPFPAFCFKVDSIYLTKADGTSIQIVDGTSSYMGIVDTHFKPISWGGSIEINFTAQGSVVGISDIDIGLADYEDSIATMVYEVPSYQSLAFNKVVSLDMSDFNLYGSQNGDGFIKEEQITATVYQFADGVAWSDTGGVVLSRDTLSGKGSTSFTKSSTTNRFYIKLTMKKYLGQTPIFRSVKLIVE
jgi:hypothetical protein